MKRGITIILAAVMALGLGLGGLSVAKNAQGTKEFISDGYILDPSEEEHLTNDVDRQYYFSAGAKYKEKFGSQILFKSSSGDKQTIDAQHFVHYNDGSLGAFTKGVLMDVSNISDSNYGYYSLTQNTVLVKNGNSYEMTSRGEVMNITEFIWKLSDTDYMLVSPNITLSISGDDVKFADYVQLTYVDNGIVRLTHQQGTYQTVAADSTLITQNGVELNLVGKNFIIDGEPAFSLDDLSIDDNSYIDVDENIKDQPTIPTFNVINGKDGANGTDGTDGEQGIEGEEGKEGEQGAEGGEGAEGASGSAGGSGGDGVEGDSGIMGYDGAEGINGKDAENSSSASAIASVDLKARPTVTVDSGVSAGSYNVTAGSAQMELKLNDSATDPSLVQGQTTVKVYNRKTMELVNTESEQQALGGSLEQNLSVVLDIDNLSQDTDYLLVVEGEYRLDDQGNTQKGILFQKVFRTEPLGIALAKEYVTDKEVAAVTKVNGVVDSYGVRFFYYNDNQEKKQIITFNGTSTGATFVVNQSVLAANPDQLRPSEFNDIPSNTMIYAELFDVTSNNRSVNTDGSQVELMTLKATPINSTKYHATTPVYEPVQAMQPKLEKDDKTHSFTVSMDPLYDKDLGIKNYRVELFDINDISSALQDYTTNGSDALSDVTPKYVKEMVDFTGCTFQVPDGDNNIYRARVVVVFDDNEKESELVSLLSDENQLNTYTANLTVEFENIQTTADMISGDIKITEGGLTIGPADTVNLGSTRLCKYINNSHPLIVEISGEYQDVYRLKLEDHNTAHPSAPFTVTKHGNYWLIHFKQEGLHEKSPYTIRVIGPYDTDGNNTLKEVEETTYLAGFRTETVLNAPIVLMAKKRANANKAFEYSLNFAPQSDNADDKAGADYSVGTMDTLVFTLYHNDGIREKVIGTPYTLKDSDADTHDSDFEGNSYKNYSDGIPNTDESLNHLTDEEKGLVLKATGVDDNSPYTVTPSSFGIDDNDAALFAGGLFKIKVSSAKDYTVNDTEHGAGGNTIPFVEKKDYILFAIEKSHVRANDPNNCITVTPITNSAAASGKDQPGLASDTVVGLRFRADYGYADINDITYNIYEVFDGKSVAADEFIGSDGYTLTEAYNDEKKVNYCYKASAAEQKCRLVLTGKHTRSGNNYLAGDVELYFEGTESLDSYNVAWKDSNGVDVGTNTILERGKRYIISYSVTADHTVTPHNDPNDDHVYPNCVYPDYPDTTTAECVPLYRSAVLELNKQAPIVERYPLSSSNGKDVWNYRIVDPDFAIIDSNSNGTGNVSLQIKKAATYGGVAAATAGTATMNALDSYKLPTAFASLEISGLTDKQFYSVGVPYKLLSSDANASYITSKPVQHFDTNTVTQQKIYMKGTEWTSTDNASDKYGDNTVSPIVNEGNYRFKLYFMGEDLDKYAAFRVKVTDGTTEVIYDPVQIETYNTLTGPNPIPYGYAYIDQGPLKDAGFENKNITFTVSGYYSTASSGFDGYVSNYDNGVDNTFYKNNTDYENVFAFRTISGTDGTSTYTRYYESQWMLTQNTGTSLLGSILAPGSAAGSGIVVNSSAGNSSTAALSQRTYTKPLVVSTESELLAKTPLVVDETGLASYDKKEYYTADKLQLASFEFMINQPDGTMNDTTTSTTISLGEVVAAIKNKRISAGTTSATLEMEFEGATTTSVRARLIRKTGTPGTVKLTKQTVGGVTFFQVDDSGQDYLELGASDIVSQKAEVRFRGLTKETNYGVLFYTLDGYGNERPLYCSDKGGVNLQYTFTTLKDIIITLQGPEHVYTSYTDKKSVFRFGVPGDEGVGMTMHYAIYAGANTTGSPIDSGTVQKLNVGSGYEYYSQNPSYNYDFNLAFPPAGPVVLGGAYTVVLEAISDESSHESLGKVTKTYYMPSSLAAPTFNLTPTPQGTDLVVTVTLTDVNKSLKPPFTVELWNDNNSLAPVQTIEVAAADIAFNGDSATKKVKFTNVPAGLYRVIARGNADLNNDNVTETEITSESVINAGSNATASPSGDATVDRLEIRLTNLSNFSAVRELFITVYDNGTPVTGIPNLITISDAEAAGTELIKELDWHAGNIEVGKYYDIKIQPRSGGTPNVTLGEINYGTKVNATNVTP